MIGFLIMVKQNIKMLLRNPGFLISIILLPIAATLMFMLQYEETTDEKVNSVIELHSDDLAVVDEDYSKLIVLAYDNSQSASSSWILGELNYYDLYKIYSYKTDSYPEDFNSWAKDYMNDNTLKVIVYFPKDFEQNLLDGKNSGIHILVGDDDDRTDLLKTGIQNSLSIMENYAQLSEDKEEYQDKLENATKDRVELKTLNIVKEGKFQLSETQENYVQNIAFAIAILSLAFVLSGVFSANIIIYEKQNLVLTRVHLSNTSVMTYVLVKVVIACIVTVIQTCLATGGILIFTKGDIGIAIGDFVLFTAGLGLIFNTLCVVCGLITDSIMNALYFSFGAWIITNMLSGVYFPSMELKGWIGKISNLTPQKWVLITSKMIMTNEKGIYSTYIAVVLAFLVAICIVGLTLSKLREKK